MSIRRIAMNLSPEQWELVRQTIVTVIIVLLTLLGYDVAVRPPAAGLRGLPRTVAGRPLPPWTPALLRVILAGLLLAGLLAMGVGVTVGPA